MDKRDIATILEEIGLLLELKGESPFKSRAYYNAARTVEGMSENIDDLLASGRIRELQGIGQALAEKLAELVATGHLLYYDQLKQTVPPGLVEMTAIPGLGPKKIAALWNQLGITTVGELEYACIENRLLGLPGFGEKTQGKIQQGILQMKRRMGFYLYANVIGEAQRILEVVKGLRHVRRAEVVGEVRRRMEIVSSIVLLAAADQSDAVLAGLQAVGEVTELMVIGQKVMGKSSLGIPVQILVSRELTPHALLAHTGSEEHLGALASRAASLKVPWNLEINGVGKLTPAVDSEQELYARLELPYIEPELREGLREIDAANAGQLGPLVEAQHIQGVFHNHTTYSDGSATLDEMV
ncbi:MAG: helix-hairpin-helix domain-containing protein, partial [Nitrospiraceae bacterium]